MPKQSHAQTASTTKRAALYPRVSTGKQEDEGTSLGTQEQRCREYAAERGYAVAEEHVYREVHTGTELWERPQLTRLREVIRRRDVDVVVAFAIDRLSRDPVHLGVILSEADHAGVAVEFVTEPLDGSPEGQLIRFIRGYAAKVEHEKIRERSIRGKRARVESGRLLPGNRPRYGFRWNEGRSAYLVNPESTPVVQRIFSLYVTGQTQRQIATQLTAEGIPTATGGSVWKHNTIRNILTEPMYTGRAAGWQWVATKTKGGRAHSKRSREGIPLPEGTVPRLIDDATFEAAQQRLRLNLQHASRNNRNPALTLLRGGYASCGYCGRSLIVRHRADRGSLSVYYCSRGGEVGATCRHGMYAEPLDAAVWGRVEQILTKPDLVAAELRRLMASDPAVEDVKTIDRALLDLAKQQRQLIDNLAFVSGAAAAVVGERIEALGEQQRRLQEERQQVLERRRAWQKAHDRLGDITAWCRTVAANLGALTYEDKRLALDALNVHVKLWRETHSPRYEITASIPLDAPIAVTSS